MLPKERLGTMEELLLPRGEGETRSPQNSFAIGGGEETMVDRVTHFFQDKCSGKFRKSLKNFCKRNGLLTLSITAVLTGCVLGFMLRGSKLSIQAKIYFSFPGELLMRMLKMLILPLITSSLMSGLSSMESKACCRMGVLTVTYYLWTTFIAVVVGILLVLIIKPGVGTDMESHRLGGGPVMTSADALLDLVRNMVPSNIIEATFQQYKTDLIPILKIAARTIKPNFVYVVPDDDDPDGRTVYLELTPAPEIQYKTTPGISTQMNVLGIVIFSATMGLLLGRMGERGAPLVNVCQCINECVMKIINAAVWYFPFGIVFLVAGKILDMQDPTTLGKKLGWYTITVLAGLFVHGLILLPLFYFILTRKNPFTYIRGLLQAMVIALATSSSSATLPITMKCLLENCSVDRQIARFVLPVGATINMDGTALYEAVAAIFIAQVNDYELDFGQLVTIRDRFRTMINVLGDALAAGIIAHLCRKDFPLGPDGKHRPSYSAQSSHHNSGGYGTQNAHWNNYGTQNAHNNYGTQNAHNNYGAQNEHGNYGTQNAHNNYGSQNAHWNNYGMQNAHNNCGSQNAHWNNYGTQNAHNNYGTQNAHNNYGSQNAHNNCGSQNAHNNYGSQNEHSHYHGVSVPMTEMHTHPDCMFDVMGDSVNEKHTVYYNICQV